MRQEQRQTLSPQMMQSMKILQMGVQELKDFINEAVLENPTLEISMDRDERADYQTLFRQYEWLSDTDDGRWRAGGPSAVEARVFDSFADYEDTQSLYNHIISQLRERHVSCEKADPVMILAGCLNDNGFLDESLEELSNELNIDIDQLEEALVVLQSLEPAGIGASGIGECLCLQLKREKPVDEIALRIAEHYLPQMAQNQIRFITKELKVSEAQVRQSCNHIRTLNPYPGNRYNQGFVPIYIVPDIVMKYTPDGVELIPSSCYVPTIHISDEYIAMSKSADDGSELKTYLTDKLRQSKWVIQAIEHRNRTILSCVQWIIDIQQDFFAKPDGQLIPMTLDTVAERMEVHPTTVSRAIRNKYLQCDKGTFPLSYFFSRTASIADDGKATSASSIKQKIAQLISEEQPDKPLSDQALCDWLLSAGFSISRRAIAKYRDELGIPSTSQRRRR